MPQRLNLNLTDASYLELRKLAERTGQSLSQTVRSALSHYDQLIAVEERGHELVERNGPRREFGLFPIEPTIKPLEGGLHFRARHEYR